MTTITGVDYIKSSPAMNYSPIPQSPSVPAPITSNPSPPPFDESKVQGYNLADPNSVEYSYFLPDESPQLISSPMATASTMAAVAPPPPMSPMAVAAPPPPRPMSPSPMAVAAPPPPRPMSPSMMNQQSMSPSMMNQQPMSPPRPMSPSMMAPPPRTAAPISSPSMNQPPFALPSQFGNTVRNVSANLLNPSSVI